jgi:type I restriction enzyme S subunit
MSDFRPLRPGDSLPEGWQWVKLKDVAKPIGGGTPSKKRPELYQGSIPWVTVADLGESLWLDKARAYITEEAIKQSATKLLPSNAVLFAIRVSVGKVAIARCPLCTNQDIRSFICGPSLNPTYLAYFLRSQVPHIAKSARGATVKGVKSEIVDNLDIPLPPLEVQRRIVAWLDEAFSYLRSIKGSQTEAERKSEALMPSKLAEVFGRAEKEGWGWVKFREVTETIELRKPKPEEEFLYVDISSVSPDGRIVEPKPLIGSKAPSRARKPIRKGDILFATTRPYLKKIALVPAELDGQICSTGFCVLRPKKDQVDSKYLFYVARSEITLSQVLPKMRGAAYPSVTDDDVLDAQIPLPPLEVQRRIAEEIEAFEKEVLRIKEGLRESREVLEKLEMALLTEAFRPERWS